MYLKLVNITGGEITNTITNSNISELFNNLPLIGIPKLKT